MKIAPCKLTGLWGSFLQYVRSPQHFYTSCNVVWSKARVVPPHPAGKVFCVWISGFFRDFSPARSVKEGSPFPCDLFKIFSEEDVKKKMPLLQRNKDWLKSRTQVSVAHKFQCVLWLNTTEYCLLPVGAPWSLKIKSESWKSLKVWISSQMRW